MFCALLQWEIFLSICGEEFAIVVVSQGSWKQTYEIQCGKVVYANKNGGIKRMYGDIHPAQDRTERMNLLVWISVDTATENSEASGWAAEVLVDPVEI